MNRQPTSKAMFLFFVGATFLVVVAGLAITFGVGHAKPSDRTPKLNVPSHTLLRSVSLCITSKDVTTLTVHRGTTMNPTTFSFPPIVFVGNVASARSVAKAICAIPPDLRKINYACPFDQGLTYNLVFTLPKYVISPITLGGTGFCSWLKGTGKSGWIRPAPNFFRILGTAMKIHLATESTFAGKIR